MPNDIPISLSYDDVLLVPQYSKLASRSQVDLSTQITPHIRLNIPLISVNMDTVTGVKMAITLGKSGGLGILPRFDSPEIQANMVKEVKSAGVTACAAIGVKTGFLDRLEQLVNASVDSVSIDVAHGHMQQVIDAVSAIKNRYPYLDLIAGAVATYFAAADLFKTGADSVRVGIGPGTICTTRIVTGFGVPQITAVLEASKAAKKFKKTVLCDGGTKNSGDIVKGLAAGSSAVIIGSQFAGTDEAPGDIKIIKGKKYKSYNGSTSVAEKLKQSINLKSEKLSKDYLNHIEGISSLVIYKGSVVSVLNQLLPGIRSGFSYAGAKNIQELHKNAKFVRVTPQGVQESNHHDVIV